MFSAGRHRTRSVPSVSSCSIGLPFQGISPFMGLHSGFFQVPAEFVAHSRKEFLLKVRVAARTEPFVKRGCQYRDRHSFINGSLDRPATLARVGDTSTK